MEFGHHKLFTGGVVSLARDVRFVEVFDDVLFDGDGEDGVRPGGAVVH